MLPELDHDSDEDDNNDTPPELAPYKGKSVWLLHNNKVSVRVCRIPNTDRWLTTSCDLLKLAAGSWELMSDEALAALLNKAQEVTARRAMQN